MRPSGLKHAYVQTSYAACASTTQRPKPHHVARHRPLLPIGRGVRGFISHRPCHRAWAGLPWGWAFFVYIDDRLYSSNNRFLLFLSINNTKHSNHFNQTNTRYQPTNQNHSLQNPKSNPTNTNRKNAVHHHRLHPRRRRHGRRPVRLPPSQTPARSTYPNKNHRTNGTIVNPTGTGVAAPTGTGSVNGTSNGGPGIQSFDNGANSVAGSALGLVVAGGVALFL